MAKAFVLLEARNAPISCLADHDCPPHYTMWSRGAVVAIARSRLDFPACTITTAGVNVKLVAAVSFAATAAIKDCEFLMEEIGSTYTGRRRR